ncbi:hypothetical protein HDU77_007740 [Chytriomyces hyalinus]|nr:hypothetical protein HDU77_007740 [Chytriomyces hyalinus]
MASKAGLFSAGGIVRFRCLQVVAWGKGWDNPSKNGVRNGGRSADYGSSVRDSRRRGKGRMAFDDDYYNCLDDDASEPTEVNANAYYENPEDWERDPADMGPDYSNVMLKIRPNELRMGDVLLISEVDVTNSEDYALDQDFVSNRKASVSDSTKESMPNNPLLSKIGILHVNMVRSNYYDRKKKRTYDAVASCTVSQFPTPSSAHPSFMYISEVLTSSVPVNRVYASLVDADDEPDRLSTENLRRAILKGHFDYVREVADMSITGVPVEGLSSSQQRAHDAAIATRKPWKPTLPAFLRHYVKPVILVGDTKQLEATVKSGTCATARFGQSLVERLQSLKHPVYMLETQYRMHPRIAEFSSGQFFDEWLMDSAFVQTYNPSCYTDPEFCIEAQLICDRLIGFLGNIQHWPCQIGIICPYKAQKHLLDELLEDALAPIQHRSEISVNTVDGLLPKGQERGRDYSFACSGRTRVVGFLDDLRRGECGTDSSEIFNVWVIWRPPARMTKVGPVLEALGGFYSHCHKRGFVKVVDERGKDAGSGALMVDAGKEGAGWDGRICTDMLADDEHEKVREEDFKHGNNNRGGDLMKEEADQSLLDAWSASFDD